MRESRIGTPSFSRRTFLAGIGGLAGTAILSGCEGKGKIIVPASPTPVPTETPLPSEDNEFGIIKTVDFYSSKYPYMIKRPEDWVPTPNTTGDADLFEGQAAPNQKQTEVFIVEGESNGWTMNRFGNQTLEVLQQEQAKKWTHEQLVQWEQDGVPVLSIGPATIPGIDDARQLVALQPSGETSPTDYYFCTTFFLHESNMWRLTLETAADPYVFDKELRKFNHMGESFQFTG